MRLFAWTDFLDERTHPRGYQLFLAGLFLMTALAGLIISASRDQVQFLGLSIPSLCPFKNLTRLDCPGCGLTRAFVLAMHGQWSDSYFLHIWGIPVMALVLIQIPYRFWNAVAGSPFRIQIHRIRWIRTFVILSVFLPWLAKTGLILSSLFLQG